MLKVKEEGGVWRPGLNWRKAIRYFVECLSLCPWHGWEIWMSKREPYCSAFYKWPSSLLLSTTYKVSWPISWRHKPIKVYKVHRRDRHPHLPQHPKTSPIHMHRNNRELALVVIAYPTPHPHPTIKLLFPRIQYFVLIPSKWKNRELFPSSEVSVGVVLFMLVEARQGFGAMCWLKASLCPRWSRPCQWVSSLPIL